MTATTESRTSRRTARRVVAAVSVVAVLVLIVACVRPMTRTSAVAGAVNDDPEAVCHRLLSAEQSGDVDAYVDCFAGELQQRVKGQVLNRAPASRSAELRDRTVDLTGVATSDLQFSAADRAALVLERIFTGHSEAQRVEFRLTDSGWKIVSQQDLGRIESRIPYGTPVSANNVRDER